MEFIYSMTRVPTFNGLDVSQLARLASVADQLGADRIANDARALAERVAEGRFYVACVGQFKRGKSTLIDALAGEEVLPTGVVPVTSVPTVIRYGQRAARVLIDGNWHEIAMDSLALYVSEEHNPENSKGVNGVEVFLPTPLLREGMCFVDTPGIGSVFAGNTAATRAFIPHIDAALVVLGTDPPISGDELDLMAEVSNNVTHLLIVLNKADRFSDDERAAARRFTEQILKKRLGATATPIFEISALEQLRSGAVAGDWSALVRRLDNLSQESGRRLIHSAIVRGSSRMRTQLLSIIEEQRQALLRPLEETETRVKNLQKIIADAEESMSDLGFLLSGVQQRVSATLVQRRDEYGKKAQNEASKAYSTELSSIREKFGPAFRRAAMDVADGIARRLVLPWLVAEQTFVEDAYSKTTRRFVDLANEFLKRVSEEGAFSKRCEQLEYEEGLNAKSEFHFEDFITIRRPASPLRYSADVLLGAIGFLSPIRSAGYEFLARLIDTNASRVQHDVEQRIAESRRILEKRIRAALRDASNISERSLQNARTARDLGQAAVERAMSTLENAESILVS